MPVLWVTSFNKKIFEVSGKHLIESFKYRKIYGDLFVGYETVLLIDGVLGQNKLHETEFAKQWRKENEDIIPIDQGGSMTPCKCPDPWSKKDHFHVKGCYHSWFNRNTYRFVNKIFSLHAALHLYNVHTYDYIIWIDADCVFTKQITYDFIEEVIFDDCKADLAILRGPRRFLEAGLVGYNLTEVEGFDLLGAYIDKYTGRLFRHYPKWDDCHILEQIIKILPVNVHDLATTLCGKHSDVFGASLIKDYISHDKGRHGRKLGIFK